MGDDYEHQRMICLIFLSGVYFIKLFFVPFYMAFDFAIPLHISLCDLETRDLETQEGRHYIHTTYSVSVRSTALSELRGNI